MPLSLDIRRVGRLVASSLVLGVAGNWIYGQLSEKEARLSISSKTAQLAGQQTIDLEIRNSGAFALSGLEATIQLQAPASLAISPSELKPFVRTEAAQIKISAPDSFVLSPSASIEIRLSSDAPNGLKDISTLPGGISSTWRFAKKVDAQWETAWIPSAQGVFVAAMILSVAALAAALVVVIRRLPPKRPG